MAHEILMPKLGLTMTEGTIEEWKLNEGDVVKKGDILFSVATDKLTNDVEAEADGVLLKILISAGETAPCKAVVAYVGAAGEAPSASACTRQPGAPVLASPAAKKLARENGVDIALIPGTGPKGRISLDDVEAYMSSSKAPAPSPVKTSPMASKLADELGVDVKHMETAGRVMKADVLKAAGITDAITDTTHADGLPEESNNLEPVKVNTLRRSIADNMSLSWHISPSVTYTRPVDCTAMKELRGKLKDALNEQGIKLTYNHILMKAAARALTEYPDVNGSFADNMLTHHKHVNMGLAVAKGDGLIVPNVKCADMKSLSEIARETQILVENTRSGKISLEDMTGGTFTITSLGPYGITTFSPIINQPELAILGVGDIVDTPVVRDGQIVILPVMNLNLTADHRVIDGVMASKFLGRICELLENPYLLLA